MHAVPSTLSRICARLLLALGAPLLLLAAAEGALRLAQAGFPGQPWLEDRIQGQRVLRDNPFFAYRFVPPPMARTPFATRVPHPKPSGALRVVVLGESAALGDPMPEFGPPRILEKLLRLRHPGRPVEVVNGAITAINSHIIREMARELPTLQPDVVILYAGNNEVIGPYGPGTVYSGFAHSDAFVRLGLLASRLRLVQLARFAVAAFFEGRIRTEFDGLAMFVGNPVAGDDPRLAAVRRRFDRNLRAIVRSAQAAGAHVVLCTVAVNRSDCPPTLSRNRTDLTERERQRWQAAFDAGGAALARRDSPAALDAFREAAAIDDSHAALRWRLGQALVQIGRPADADSEFRAACELDAFRYRADDALNRIARNLAESHRPAIALLDADALFSAHSGASDSDLFVDHVHFSLQGAILLAEAWAAAVERATDPLGQTPSPMPSPDAIRAALLHSSYAELDFARRLLTRHTQAPFATHDGADQRIQSLLSLQARLQEEIWNADLATIERATAERMADDPADPILPQQWGKHLLEVNERRRAEPYLRHAAQLAPHRTDLRLPLVRLLAATGHAEEAADALLHGRRKHGFFAAGGTFQTLTALVANGQVEEAAAFCRAVRRSIRPLDYRWRVTRAHAAMEHAVRERSLAYAQMEQGDFPQAMRAWKALAVSRPDMAEPLFWLGAWHELRREPQTAQPLLQAASQRWNPARDAFHRGLLLAQLGRRREAREELSRAADWARDDLPLVRSLAHAMQFHPNPEIRDPARAAFLLASLGESPAAPVPAPLPLGSWLLAPP